MCLCHWWHTWIMLCPEIVFLDPLLQGVWIYEYFITTSLHVVVVVVFWFFFSSIFKVSMWWAPLAQSQPHRYITASFPFSTTSKFRVLARAKKEDLRLCFFVGCLQEKQKKWLIGKKEMTRASPLIISSSRDAAENSNVRPLVSGAVVTAPFLSLYLTWTEVVKQF